MEFFDLMLLPDKSLYHSGSIYIFLNRIIQDVIFVKYLYKMRMGFFRNKKSVSAQKRYYHKK